MWDLFNEPKLGAGSNNPTPETVFERFTTETADLVDRLYADAGVPRRPFMVSYVRWGQTAVDRSVAEKTVRTAPCPVLVGRVAPDG